MLWCFKDVHWHLTKTSAGYVGIYVGSYVVHGVGMNAVCYGVLKTCCALHLSKNRADYCMRGNSRMLCGSHGNEYRAFWVFKIGFSI